MAFTSKSIGPNTLTSDTAPLQGEINGEKGFKIN